MMLRRSAVAGLLAAAFSAAPALAQQKVEVQFWHAMSGVLGERAGSIAVLACPSTVLMVGSGPSSHTQRATMAPARPTPSRVSTTVCRFCPVMSRTVASVTIAKNTSRRAVRRRSR